MALFQWKRESEIKAERHIPTSWINSMMLRREQLLDPLPSPMELQAHVAKTHQVYAELFPQWSWSFATWVVDGLHKSLESQGQRDQLAKIPPFCRCRIVNDAVSYDPIPLVAEVPRYSPDFCQSTFYLP